jgi:hypothetical protein
MALTKFEKDISYISKLADQPNDVSGGELSAADLKAKFDQAGNDIKEYINTVLIPEVSSDIQAAAEGVGGEGKISADKLEDGSITGQKLADGAVNTAKIADNAISTAKIADGSVTTEKIANDSVTAEKLADSSVDRNAIKDEAVSTAKLFAGAVTTDKLKDSSVTADKIAPNAITRAKLAKDALGYPVFSLGENPTELEQKHLNAIVRSSWNKNATLLITAENSSDFTEGDAIALLHWGETGTFNVQIDGVSLALTGESIVTSGGIQFAEPFQMIVLQKVQNASDSNNHGWLIIGSAEVVS